jgi:hypothetical protein
MLNKIFNIVNRFIYYSNHPTPPEIAVAIITGLTIGVMFGFWLDKNDLADWDKIKERLKKNKKTSWIFKK